VSSAPALQLIREAKAQGLAVTCDTATYHLLFDDSQLLDFDSNYKVNPPLRTPEDQWALLNGLADHTIDVLVSNHLPQDPESKNVAFDQAAFGMNVLEHNFALINQVLRSNPKLQLEQLIEKITHRPREILHLPLARIEEGERANFTIFDPEINWSLEKGQSRSMNNPFIGRELIGKPCALFNNGKFQKIL
ncbi:MAG: dihydroorotase, partial [Bacteroidota bacterium]